jgi:hypothetical protein
MTEDVPMPSQRKSDLERLRDQLLKRGVDLSGIDLPIVAEESLEDSDEVIIEAQGVLLYIETEGKGFRKQDCPECGRQFAYRYTFQMPGMLCSNRCRKSRLAKLGIAWKSDVPLEKRFAHRRELPLVIPPEALDVLRVVVEEDDF